ncbi:WD40 repeat-like protein [Pleurotus eryngii]|uniref:WD40 repeat-like protein n=1 Tax=Pleurotus eryngii TaxID=5323 RepID=A0A9P6A7W8_PLEER|nr:WD40 repeat-like protein [Pleurotus eryngii]
MLLGDHVVLITHCADGRHLLRLYDVRNRMKTLSSTVTLEPVTPAAGQSGEINCLVYSPDGLYIAAARNDGATHVYDMRMLDRGPVSRFRHHQRSRMVSPSYGVVRAQWLETHRSRLALVTGGDDGDVRLWDPLQSDSNPTNGQVLAHSDWDIAHFVVGDVSQNEKPLIIGDSGGRITVYDSRHIFA